MGAPAVDETVVDETVVEAVAAEPPAAEPPMAAADPEPSDPERPAVRSPAATFEAVGIAGGGEKLPVTGNCPPSAPEPAVPWVGLRAGLAPALLSACAKSPAAAPELKELTEAEGPDCAGSGVCDTAGIEFISKG